MENNKIPNLENNNLSAAPKRSDTLNSYIKNMGYTDDDIVTENDDMITFNSRPQFNEDYQRDYDKKTDTFNVNGIPGNAAKFNKDFNHSIGLHNSYLSNLKYSIDNDSDCYFAYKDLIQNYADGIMKRSKGNKNPDTAYEIAEQIIGPFSRFKRSVQTFYRK